MELAGMFMLGLVLGYSLTLFHITKLTRLVEEIEVKYTRLLAIIGEWQKRI